MNLNVCPVPDPTWPPPDGRRASMGEDLEAVVDGEHFPGDTALGLDALAGPSSTFLVCKVRAVFAESARLALDCCAMPPGDAGRPLVALGHVADPPRSPKDERGEEDDAASRMALWTSGFKELMLDDGDAEGKSVKELLRAPPGADRLFERRVASGLALRSQHRSVLDGEVPLERPLCAAALATSEDAR